MRKAIIVLMILGLLVSCEESSNSEKASKNKHVTDSLALQKKSKTKEIQSLNSELDSLRRLSDSLKAISK